MTNAGKRRALVSPEPPSASCALLDYIPVHDESFGVPLHSDDVRWAAAEGVSEDVIAAVMLLHERSVEEVVTELRAAELEQVIKLAGRSQSAYPPGTLDALKQHRTSISLQPPGDSGASELAAKEPARRTASAQGRDTRLGAGGHSPQSINGAGSPQAAVASPQSINGTGSPQAAVFASAAQT